MEFQLRPGLLLGAATSVPAGAGDEKGRLWREDLRLMGGMGLSCCRVDVDWARVEPEDGVFDEEAVARCRAALQELLDRGVRPLVNLWRFGAPLWLERRGGFANRDNITCYLRYVRKMVESVGDLAGEYITVSEPNVYAYNSFFQGVWPPGRRSLLDMSRVMTHLAAAHIEAYGLIRKTRLQMGFRDTRVGFANHLRIFAPRDPANPVHRFWASRSEQLFQGSLTRAMCLGRRAFPIANHPAIVPGRYCDFHGVSYCTRSTVSGPAGGTAPGRPVDGLGREIYPEGIAEAARKVYGLLPRPIYITENAVCDGEDAFRARYIAEHLQALCQSGLPVERYCYGRFCDGGAWEGSAQMGLVRVDGGRRTVKRSGDFYRRVAEEGGVSEELDRAFCRAPYPENPEEDA